MKNSLEQSKILNYLCFKELYVRDSYVCADPQYRMNIRIINEYAWSNLFAYNMFLRPTDDEINTAWTNYKSQDQYKEKRQAEEQNKR